MQNSGEAYLSNAVVRGKFALRACIVNFRTTQADIEALPPLIVRLGKETDSETARARADKVRTRLFETYPRPRHRPTDIGLLVH